MIDFKQGTRGYLPKDLIHLKSSVGGKVGTLIAGGEKIPEVLSVGKGVYACLKEPSKAVRAELEAEGRDLHVIKSTADLTVFMLRWETFNHAS